jgi:endonuclease/exonuclease/phosphatase family metal-dependent hydrolase
MTFSILYWNIWLDNQIKGEDNSKKLLSELKQLLDRYSPEFIGLNEVLQGSKLSNPFILDYLKNECDYEFGYFAPASRFDDDWFIGAGFCSKVKPNSIKEVAISKDTPAERRGYKGFELKAITAQVALNDTYINIIVAHPLHLRPYTLRDHYQGTKTLENLVRSEEFSKNTILGGDFNEPGFMPKAFKNNVKDIMHMRTGSMQNPTWRHNAKPNTLIRANLDQLYWSKDSDFSLESFEVIETNISDHRPILATFSYK